MTLTTVPEHIVAEYDSQVTISYFKRFSKVTDTFPIRSAAEIMEDFWHLWTRLIPSKMSATLIEDILTMSPELPAEEDPSTHEFTQPEE